MISVARKSVYGEATKTSVYRSYRYNANKRCLEFNFSKDDFLLLCLKNCYYCGQSPSNKTTSTCKNGDFVYSGVDRLDNDKGYTKENCVPCCRRCNFTKNKMSHDEFFEHIRKILTIHDGRS